jgi:hypothetical protein
MPPHRFHQPESAPDDVIIVDAEPVGSLRINFDPGVPGDRCVRIGCFLQPGSVCTAAVAEVGRVYDQVEAVVSSGCGWSNGSACSSDTITAIAALKARFLRPPAAVLQPAAPEGEWISER